MAAKFGVKNRAPAAIQITAEQLLREAHDRGGGSASGHARRQRSQITDPDELREYRMTQRKGFEDAIRMNRVHLGNYVKYAKWEEAQEAFERARSVFERALDVDHRSQSLWLKYAEMEMRNKFVNHARNVWDRATAILPRVDQFWYKYTFMEEMVENHAACRAVFERWMAWEPDDRAWHAYAAFEERRGDARRARAVLERFVACHPRLPSYLKYARWEERQQQPTLARDAYERALRELGQWEFEAGEEAALYRAFARFEERQREHGRARAILVHACATLDRDAHADVHADLLAFEKKHGAVDAVERQVAEQRRSDYEARVRDHPRDYDAWFDLLRLEEARFRATGDAGRCRAACARVRPGAAGGGEAVLAALRLPVAGPRRVRGGRRGRRRRGSRGAPAALGAVPHAAFTFAKLWLAAADLEVRAKDLGAARRLLGEARPLPAPRQGEAVPRLREPGTAPRRGGPVPPRLRRVGRGGAGARGRVDRARRPRARRRRASRARGSSSSRWRGPTSTGPRRRGRATSTSRRASRRTPRRTTPPTPAAGENAVAALYERLLERTRHVKVWLAYAAYEAAAPGEAAPRPRERAARLDGAALRDAADDDRVALLDAWRAFEAAAARAGDARAHLDAVEAKLPRKVKRKRPRADDPDASEEYYAFVFPDDARKPVNLKILEMAKQWKRAEKARAGGDSAATGGGAT